MKIYLKIIIFILIILSIVIITGCSKNNSDAKFTIISTSFPGYDFTRAVTKDIKDIDVKMLLKPGAEMHDYEPTPQDIKNIKNSNIFIYVGGDSDEWIKDVLNNIDLNKTKVIKLMNLVNLQEEEIIEGMEVINKDKEYDEHIWTNPINAITIINKLKDEIIEIDNLNKSLYEKNANSYISSLNDIDKEIKSIVKNAKRKELIFGDRFPFLYFTREYGLTYYAAFPGCSEQTEASAKTISFLIDKVKEDNIPVILKLELSNGKIADTIAKETNTKVLEFNSFHNISQKDFNSGITYIEIMKNNIKVLKEALN